jgi:hypothetical protein
MTRLPLNLAADKYGTICKRSMRSAWLAFAVILAGCTPGRQINEGASIEIHLAPQHCIAARYAKTLRDPGAVTDWAPTDSDRPQAWLPSDEGQAGLVRSTIHETIRHILPRMGVISQADADRALAAMETPSWTLTVCGPVSERERAAMEAAAKANAERIIK